MSTTPWPTSYEYAMAHPCPTCKVEAGIECDAPQKRAQFERALPAYDEPDRHRHGVLHKSRQAAGVRHFERDKTNAPWPEERVPGQRYDTLGDKR